ncbi:MAG: phosphoribosyltransferase family protein [Ignavibacteria bacterium]
MSNSIKDILFNKSTTLFNDVVDFLYPKICIVSDSRIPDDNSNDFVIDSILQSFELINEDEFSFMRSKINADFFFSKYAFRHESGIQSLIHYLKYRGFTKIGTFLGNIIGTELKLHYTEKLKEYTYLLPVPLYSGKLRERGFNQSMFICKGIVEVLPMEILNENIIRVKNTKSQTGLSFEERIENVKDAFALNPKLKNSELNNGILVVDDVITTGSTIKEVIRLLKQETSVSVGAVSIGLAK